LIGFLQNAIHKRLWTNRGSAGNDYYGVFGVKQLLLLTLAVNYFNRTTM